MRQMKIVMQKVEITKMQDQDQIVLNMMVKTNKAEETKNAYWLKIYMKKTLLITKMMRVKSKARSSNKTFI